MDRGEVDVNSFQEMSKDCAFSLCRDQTHPVSSPLFSFLGPLRRISDQHSGAAGDRTTWRNIP